MSIGFTVGLGGGWADQVLAHRSMLHPIPDAVPDAIASLHEPVSIGVHGLLRKPPRDGDPVLVVGAGIIGLAAVAAVRALFPTCEVTVTARHAYQGRGRAARRARITSCAPQDGYAHFDELAAISGATVTGRRSGQMLLGGFPYVIEAVGGLESVTESMRLVDNWGTVLFIGAGGMGEVDLSALWFKEAELVGAWNHSHGVHPTRGHAPLDRPRARGARRRRTPRVDRDAHVRARRRPRRGRDRDRQTQQPRDQSRLPPRRASVLEHR